MPTNFGPMTLKLNKGDIFCMAKGGTSAVCGKMREVYFLTNMHNTPASGHFVDEEGNASKPLCIESYNRSAGFVDLSDMMANSYSISYKR
jgi:hypothetical protein